MRLHENQKKLFAEATERCGIDASVAARQLLELLIQRLESGGDYIDALYELKKTWQSQTPGSDIPDDKDKSAA